MKTLFKSLALVCLLNPFYSQAESTDQMKVGEIKCYYTVNQASIGDGLIDTDGGLGGNELYREVIMIDIAAPKSCLKNPDWCEGGPLKTASLRTSRLFEYGLEKINVQLFLTYEDEHTQAEIRTSQAAAYTSLTEIQNGGGPSLQVNDKVFVLTCSRDLF